MAETKAKRAPKATKEPAVKVETPPSSQSSHPDSKKSKGTGGKRAAKSKTSVKREDKNDTAKQQGVSVEEVGKEWILARHPLLDNAASNYYVNIKGQIAVWHKNLRILEPVAPSREPITDSLPDDPKFITIPSSKPPTYKLKAGSEGTYRHIQLVEVMIWTFVGDIQEGKDVVFYKDGQKKNCAMSNLVVCNMEQLQLLEAQRLTRLLSVEFAPVKFGDRAYLGYVVGKNGQVFDILRHVSVKISQAATNSTVKIYDVDKNVKFPPVCKLVMEAFEGPCPDGSLICHLNDDIRDNSFENLRYLTKKEHNRMKNKLKPQAETKSMPPATKDTKWATVGKVPWSGKTYSQYEVSSMGHVRHKASGTIVNEVVSSSAKIRLRYDQDKNDTKPRSFNESVARLVANSFVKPGYSAAHNAVKRLNGDMFDNSAKNLKWVSMDEVLQKKAGYKVTAKLVGDPKSQKTFPSKYKAANELGISEVQRLKHGASIEREVLWNKGSEKRHLAQILVA